jgi:hypothetical protein
MSYVRYFMNNNTTLIPPKPTNPNAPANPEFYGPGLPGQQANELQRGLLEDFIVRTQNTPGFTE